MSKIHAQNFPIVLLSSASFLSTACPSGSFLSKGYARIVGIVYGGCTMDAGSAIRIEQSSDLGVNWDFKTEYSMSACSGSAFSIEIIGNAVRVTARSSTCDVNPFRTLWQLRPV